MTSGFAEPHDAYSSHPRNPDDLGRGPLIIGFTWALMILAVGAVCLRMWVMGRPKGRGLMSDDWLMFAAMILQTGSQICLTLAFAHGCGKHDPDLWFPEEPIQISKWFWISVAPGITASVLARISITVLLIRLFGVTHTWLKHFLVFLALFQVCFGIAIILGSYLQVSPVDCLWNFYRYPTITRWDARSLVYLMYVGQSIFSLADLAYAAIPTAIIWNLNMPLRQRIGLVLVMGASLFTMTMSILKTIWAGNIDSSTASNVHLGNDSEPLYNQALSMFWVVTEQNCVILLGCVPPLLNFFLKELNLRSMCSPGVTFLSRVFTGFGRKGNVDKEGKSSTDASASGISGPYQDIDLEIGRLHSDNSPPAQPTS